jgi:hypothetical protein
MSDKFDDELREHLHHEAQQVPEFPRRLRGRIREGITPRRHAPLAPQLALAGALVVVAVALLAVRNSQVIINTVPTTIRNIFQPSPSPTPQPFTCSDRSGGTNGLSAQLTGIRVAHHAEAPGFDRIVFDFSGGIPSYDLTRQESATFVKDASGQSITLDGSAGIKLVFRDSDVQGVPADQKPNLPSVREIAQLGDFERVLSYGVGVTSSQCVRVLELTNPPRLVVDVMTSPAPSASAAPTPLPTAPQATDLGPFTCQDAAGGTSTGPAMQLTAVRVAHQSAGYDRIVFEFAAPSGASPHMPVYTVSRQASSNFVKDPSGLPVTMQGSSGLRIVFHGASGSDTYNGSRDLTPNLPVIKEVEQLGDFEAVLSWGAGLSRASCIRTLELTNPTRLVIDVQTP